MLLLESRLRKVSSEIAVHRTPVDKDLEQLAQHIERTFYLHLVLVEVDVVADFVQHDSLSVRYCQRRQRHLAGKTTTATC